MKYSKEKKKAVLTIYGKNGADNQKQDCIIFFYMLKAFHLICECNNLISIEKQAVNI
jgi:hypothetical protein